MWLKRKQVEQERATTPSVAKAALPRGYFFVCGHPRSGTNWICNLLNLHPHVRCEGEFHFEQVLRAVEAISEHPWQGAGKEPCKGALRASFENMVKTTLDAVVADQPEKRWVGDRTPRHLEPMVRGARHFLCVRDGRDVLVSWTFHLLKHGGAWLEGAPGGAAMTRLKARFDQDRELFDREPALLLTTNPEWVRHYARQWAERVRADQAMLERFEREPELGQAMLVRYEDVHADVGPWQRRMYEFLELDPGLATAAEENKRTRPGFTAGKAHAFFRSGQVGDWKRYFDEATLRCFEEVASEAMVRLGYGLHDQTEEPSRLEVVVKTSADEVVTRSRE